MQRLLLTFFLILLALFLSSSKEGSSDLLSKVKKSALKKSIKFFSVKEKRAPASSSLQEKELLVDLKSPTLINGILSSKEGGVCQNQDIRIQAMNIRYINRMEEGHLVHRIEADEELLVQYKGRAFVGKRLDWDLNTKTGILYSGKTKSPPWYIGGDRIYLKSDGNYRIKNVSLTTCENRESSWDIHAGEVNVDRKNMISVSKVRFRVFQVPTLWLPSFRMSTKKFFSSSLFRYKLDWDKHSGPRASFRYQFYSWKDLSLFARFEYRLKRGFGGALESEYYPDDGRTFFETKNYLATDVVPNNPVLKRRYRLQGHYRSTSLSAKTTAELTWDKYSDIYMPQDFKSEDFEINTAKKTEGLFRHQENDFVTILYARPRVLPFETIKQDLPTFFLSSRSFSLPSLGLFTSQKIKASYLSYAYAHDLHVHLKNFHSGRFEAFHEMYRPFFLGPFQITPLVGASGIVYTENRCNHDSRFLGSLYYSCPIVTRFSHSFSRHLHQLEPFLTIQGWTHPSLAIYKHYIFSIQDGYHELHQLTMGLSNRLYSLCHSKSSPSFQVDLYSHGFLDEHKTRVAFPKIYLDFEWNLPSCVIVSQNGWNVKYKTLDHANIRGGWTINQDVALLVEFRYRSRYDWRKADKENFILDVTRSQEELLHSPLSDRRNTLLAKMFFRLHPLWSCTFESHHGWNRMQEKPYHEFRVDLFALLSTSWRLRMSLEHTEKDTRVTAGFDLIKK
jgi:hypothetical protein